MVQLSKRTVRGVAIAALVVGVATPATAVSIDPGVIPGGYSATRDLPVSYQFQTSWDGIVWTEEEKDSARAALDFLSGYFLAPSVFVEVLSSATPVLLTPAGKPADFTLRWAGNDFFKDWVAANPGFFVGKSQKFKDRYDFRNSYGMTVKPEPDGTTDYPWDKAMYPEYEIYFNKDEAWNFNPFKDDPFKLDFWSVFLHEIIHIMSVDEHSKDPMAVMYHKLEYGEKKYELKESDLQLLQKAGYSVIPAPAPFLLLASAFGLSFIGARLSRKRNGSPSRYPVA